MSRKTCKKVFALSLAFVFIFSIFTACGASQTSSQNFGKNVSSGINSDYFEPVTPEEDMSIGNNETNEKTGNNSTSELTDMRKLVKNANLSIETVDMDKSVGQIESSVKKLNGYIENSSVSGNSFADKSFRYADITVRIPSESLDDFLFGISECEVITSKKITVNDITSNYIDTESHIKALETEQDALLAILGKADKVSEIIEVQSRLSQVRASLESYKSQLKSYDKQVAYSKVEISLREVEKTTVVEERGFFGKIKDKLTNNLENIWKGFECFVIWFVSTGIPYGVFIGSVLVICWFIGKRRRKIHKDRKEK